MPLPEGHDPRVVTAVTAVEKAVTSFKEALPYTAPEAMDFAYVHKLLIPVVEAIVALEPELKEV